MNHLNHHANRQTVSRTTFSDDERYEWIRGHRGDLVIDHALSHSDRDRDFDMLIDAAMEVSRRGARQPLATLRVVASTRTR